MMNFLVRYRVAIVRTIGLAIFVCLSLYYLGIIPQIRMR